MRGSDRGKPYINKYKNSNGKNESFSVVFLSVQCTCCIVSALRVLRVFQKKKKMCEMNGDEMMCARQCSGIHIFFSAAMK